MPCKRGATNDVPPTLPMTRAKDVVSSHPGKGGAMLRSTSTVLVGWLALAMFTSGCGSDDTSDQPVKDAGQDVADAGKDSPSGDAIPDMKDPDVTADTPHDISTDVPEDVEQDVPSGDAIDDTLSDVVEDSADDVQDALGDSPLDGPDEATSDAPTDAPTDVPIVVNTIDVQLVLADNCSVTFTPTEIDQTAGSPIAVRVTNASTTYRADLWTSNGAAKFMLAPGASWTTPKTFCNELKPLEAHIEAFNHDDLDCDPGRLLIHCL